VVGLRGASLIWAGRKRQRRALRSDPCVDRDRRGPRRRWYLVDLVFFGWSQGLFEALHAETGELLWQVQAGKW